ncbi:peptidase family m13 protein [Colletotrichum truncatum]|uniref:Peptidase family m13 protein n=1 Tax=Colletotrichum truncatum TaxID=5467 RepID=A0ACC3YCK6_COLTU|nr:peptidase family m13 protein [Colletotrichum truncatum]KAF6794057.1 peptidase family m13 protein [Colletotrichum truncatum]
MNIVRFQLYNLQALVKTDDSRDGENKPAKKFKLEDVTLIAPELDHGSIVKALVPQEYTPEQLVFSPGYFGNLSQLLSNTTAETLQTFFIWRATTVLSGYVEADVTNRLNDMISLLGGLDPVVVGKVPRWRQCVSSINAGPEWTQFLSGLGWIVSRFFLDKSYSKEARELTTSFMSSIQDTFIARLGDKDWLSPPVRKIAEEKVNAITKKIGYPDQSPETTNPKSLSDYFSGASIGSCHLENMLSLALSSTNRTWSYLSKPTEKGFWYMLPSRVDAYYLPALNDIVIPAAMQQKLFFAAGYPSYITYGGLGTVLGHELTHGFGNTGHNYAPNGSLVNWWDNSSTKGFRERTKCFVDQYQNFTLLAPNGTRVSVRGKFTLGENIADAGGLTTAYAAWKHAQADKKVQDFDLPGLERLLA